MIRFFLFLVGLFLSTLAAFALFIYANYGFSPNAMEQILTETATVSEKVIKVFPDPIVEKFYSLLNLQYPICKVRSRPEVVGNSDYFRALAGNRFLLKGLSESDLGSNKNSYPQMVCSGTDEAIFMVNAKKDTEFELRRIRQGNAYFRFLKGCLVLAPVPQGNPVGKAETRVAATFEAPGARLILRGDDKAQVEICATNLASSIVLKNGKITGELIKDESSRVKNGLEILVESSFNLASHNIAVTGPDQKLQISVDKVEKVSAKSP